MHHNVCGKCKAEVPWPEVNCPDCATMLSKTCPSCEKEMTADNFGLSQRSRFFRVTVETKDVRPAALPLAPPAPLLLA